MIVDSYRQHQFVEELRGEWACVVLYRPLALLITWIFVRTWIQPNHVTLMNGVILFLMLFASFALEPAQAVLSLCLLAVVYSILDCVDGSLAQVQQMQSAMGHYLDFAFDIAYRVILYAGLGYLADVLSDPILTRVSFLSIGLTAAWIHTFARLCRVYLQARSSPVAEPADTHPRDARTGVMNFVFSAFSGIDHTLPLLALICWRFDVLGWLMVWLAAYSLLDFIHTQISIFRRLRA